MGEEDKIIKKEREVSWCILNKRKGGLLMYIKRFVKHYYIMLVPAFLWLFFFSIVPMFGIVMAFRIIIRDRASCIPNLLVWLILSICFR